MMRLTLMLLGARSVREHGRVDVKRLDLAQRHCGKVVVTVCHVVRRLCRRRRDNDDVNDNN